MFELSNEMLTTTTPHRSWRITMGKTETVTRRKNTAPAEPEGTDEDVFEELEEDEDDTTEVEADDLEDLDEADEDEDEAPAKKPKAKKTDKSKAKPAVAKKTAPAGAEYSSKWLAAHVTEITGENYDARAVRMLLRKMAADGTLPRVVGEDRDRYIFPEGPKSEIVKAVIAMVKSGEATKIKRAGLDKVKADADAKKAAKKAAAAKEEAEEADEDEDDDEVEEAPVTKTKKKAKAGAAPAKATVSRKRAKA
jgi:colicin import membrane protein